MRGRLTRRIQLGLQQDGLAIAGVAVAVHGLVIDDQHVPEMEHDLGANGDLLSRAGGAGDRRSGHAGGSLQQGEAVRAGVDEGDQRPRVGLGIDR